MHDDAWWDGEDDGRIAELQRVLAPLREPARPWGDVHARVRFDAPPQRIGGTVVRVVTAALAIAAAIALGWWWGHADASHPAIAPVIEDVPVAEPPPPIAPPAPQTIIVPMPVPIVATDEAVASGARREMLYKQFAHLDKHRKQRAAGLTQPDADEAATRVEAAVRASAPDVAARIDDPPETLTTQDIKTAIAPHRAAAKACGVRHKAAPGDSVNIKLSIRGETGRVTSAVAQSPHAGTELGRCVAEALAEAVFPRFRKPSLGVVYPIAM